MRIKYAFLPGIILLISIFTILTGCPGNGSPLPDANQSPYPVTAPFTSRGYAQTTGLKTFQLEIAEQGGLADPDGDTVYFRSSPLPSWIMLDEDTGIVTVDTAGAQLPVEYSFWSEDEHGKDTSDAPYGITISVTMG